MSNFSRRFAIFVLAVLTFAVLTFIVTGQDVPDFGAPFPSEPVPGVRFPTAETTINSWVFADPPDLERIYEHGWAIWAGLTTAAGEATGESAFGIDDALVYQTWLAPKDIIALMRGDEPGRELSLRSPLQHRRGGGGPDLIPPAESAGSGIDIDYAVAEVVAYSPASAGHAYSNQLLWTETLTDLVEAGYTALPPFPNDAINIKAVYKLISEDELTDGSLYAMPAWPGTPDTSNWSDERKRNGYPNTEWNHCVYIDVTNAGVSTATGVDEGCSSPSADTTYGLGDFISVPITREDQAHFAALTGGQWDERDLRVGDTLILVGMHVTTRETQRWTWQTFWWAADPDDPNAPSSAAIAAARPPELAGPASHYAMSVAYSMLSPAQPLVGGHNVGALVPAYNPHLEAGFGTATFGETRSVQTPTGAVTTDLGVQSNCMSCHGMAGYATADPTYVSNFYLPLDAPNFRGGMSADFAWSIVDEAVSKHTE